MTWAILICTLPERFNYLEKLKKKLDYQLIRHPSVFYRIHDGLRSMPTGMKRNQLVEQSTSDFFSFVDDDDEISDDYVNLIVDALQSSPDVVTFNGWMTTNGQHRRNFTIKLGSDYVERNGHYYRFPNHLTVMKRSLVQSVKFPELWEREDYLWAKQIHDRKLLKTSVHIEKDLYHYAFNSNKPGYQKVKVIR